MATPLATFLSTGFFIGAALLVYGIIGLVQCLRLKLGALGIVVNILAIICGVISFIRPGTALIFDGVMLYVIAFWFLLHGIALIVIAFQKKSVNKRWYWGIIAGILGILLGIYSFAHPMVTAVAAGILIGLYFIQSGVSLIALGSALKD